MRLFINFILKILLHLNHSSHCTGAAAALYRFVDINKMVINCHHLKMPPALQIPEAHALE